MLACLVLMLNVCWDYVGAGPNLKLRARGAVTYLAYKLIKHIRDSFFEVVCKAKAQGQVGLLGLNIGFRVLGFAHSEKSDVLKEEDCRIRHRYSLALRFA